MAITTDATQDEVNSSQRRYATAAPKRKPKAYDLYMAAATEGHNYIDKIGSKKGLVVADGPYKGMSKNEMWAAAQKDWDNPEVQKKWGGIASGSLDTPEDKANEADYDRKSAAALGGSAPGSTGGSLANAPIHSGPHYRSISYDGSNGSQSTSASTLPPPDPYKASGASFASNSRTAPMQMRTEAERQARIAESNSRNAAIPISSKRSGTLVSDLPIPVKQEQDGRVSIPIPAQYGGGTAYGGTARPAPANAPVPATSPSPSPTDTPPAPPASTVMPPPASVTQTGGSWGAPSTVSANPNPPTVMPPPPPPSSVANANAGKLQDVDPKILDAYKKREEADRQAKRATSRGMVSSAG